ncbi:MAG TPA: hypothetical protein PK992_10155, partial [Planctomycetaceae bacterium]|nr:hypothetical protein [Planctomycetaceae bacterium]
MNKKTIVIAFFTVLFPLHSVVRCEEVVPASISVAPADVHLSAVRDRQGLIVQAVLPNGLTVDVTDQSVMTVGNEATVRRDGATFYPVADGETKITVTYAG